MEEVFEDYDIKCLQISNCINTSAECWGSSNLRAVFDNGEHNNVSEQTKTLCWPLWHNYLFDLSFSSLNAMIMFGSYPVFNIIQCLCKTLGSNCLFLKWFSLSEIALPNVDTAIILVKQEMNG